MYPNRFIPFAFLCLAPSLYSQAQEVPAKKQELPQNWHLLSPAKSGFYGVSNNEAYQFLDSLNIKPTKITVAVIDADLNVNHEDLKARVWKNPKPGSKGYPNDLNGWNFLGNKDGRNLLKTGTEAFREYKRLRPRFEKVQASSLKTAAEQQEYAYFLKLRKEVKIGAYIKFGAYLQQISDAFVAVDSFVRASKPANEPRTSDILALKIEDPKLSDAYKIVQGSMLKFKEESLWKEALAATVKESEVANERIKSLDDKAVPRDLIGDTYTLKDKYYGNANLYEAEVYHGTFVAGLIGAVRNNGIGIDGIADSVAIMGVRAVPDGDEYDKDVALAIRYAVDNGAKLINMSFGKYISPNSEWVNDAVKYADKKGVLLFHAAGNEGLNVDSVSIYPSGMESATKRAANLIRVGASDASGTAASISNYGATQVDLFAPGINITSTGLNNGYQTANGTSLSTPIVTGVAALIWSYFPKLSAREVRRIILASVTSLKDNVGPVPGKGKRQVSFGQLSVTGGIVNAYQAVKMAQKSSQSKK
ncbi:S8 family serine peptidase [Pedobacter caeni]|uniref:Subtilase family protein n=1 Tax=Pedobacter caeni TaxID=288992 RepID=A0A1M5G1E3_9SPHI|nr:S8 family serine peptidase [Pedobacter caeni]SHF97538.1 Subtilase family protein [Pedobacter caeni]